MLVVICFFYPIVHNVKEQLFGMSFCNSDGEGYRVVLGLLRVCVLLWRVVLDCSPRE